MTDGGFAKSLVCELVGNTHVNGEVFILQFLWKGHAPKAGQFFMVKPLRSSVFLPRPISVFDYSEAQNTVKFLIAKRGMGTDELSQMNAGEKAQLTGPLGNTWADFLPENGIAALVGGGVGIAPLAALVSERPDYNFHFYAGFRGGFRQKEEENAMLGGALYAKKLVVSAEDGRNALGGRIVDFLFEPESYSAILTCGPEPMLKAVMKKCEARGVACYVSLERRMACGVGACLGCTVRTAKGNLRCCVDGPVFSAGELIFDE
jgi:NAD(P)H-flavin reductase